MASTTTTAENFRFLLDAFASYVFGDSLLVEKNWAELEEILKFAHTFMGWPLAKHAGKSLHQYVPSGSSLPRMKCRAVAATARLHRAQFASWILNDDRMVEDFFVHFLRIIDHQFVIESETLPSAWKLPHSVFDDIEYYPVLVEKFDKFLDAVGRGSEHTLPLFLKSFNTKSFCLLKDLRKLLQIFIDCRLEWKKA